MKKITFSSLHIVEELVKQGQRYVEITKETFTDIKSSDFSLTIDNTYYQISLVNHDEYIWFSINYGKPMPRDSNLTDIDSGEKRSNPRQTNEAELKEQFFALYKYDDKFFYISNLNKISILKSILKDKLNKDFLIKKVFIDFEEFINIIKEVKSISFTEALNLFNRDSKKRQALKDLTGTGAPEKFTLKARYTSGSLINLIPFLRDSNKGKENGELKSLIIKGEDESGFPQIFSHENFTKKIEFYAKINNEGQYEVEFIEQKLLSIIGNER